MFGKFLNPKNDYAFKFIFGTERNKDILIHFLNDILGLAPEHEILDVTYLKTIQDPEIASKKQSAVDVLCTDRHGHQYIVEMQVAKYAGFEKRAMYYASKAYYRQLDKGGAYQDLKQVIFLAISDFVMFPKKEDYRSDHVILDAKLYSRDLKDFSFTFLELPKFTKKIDELSGIIEHWMYFFKHAEDTTEADLKLLATDKIIERAYGALNRFSWTEEQLNAYEASEKIDRDNQAVLDAMIQDNTKEIAENLLKSNVPIDIIAKSTGLSLEEINLIKHKNS